MVLFRDIFTPQCVFFCLPNFFAKYFMQTESNRSLFFTFDNLQFSFNQEEAIWQVFFFFWLNAVLFTLCMPKDSHRYLYYFNAILFLPMMGQNLKFPLIINSPCLFIYFFNKVKYFMLLKCVTTTLLLYIYIYIYIQLVCIFTWG